MPGNNGNGQNNGNVIIPYLGAAAYWYVDPRATGVPAPLTPAAIQMIQRNVQAQQIQQAQAQAAQAQAQAQMQAQRQSQQERADIYDQMRYLGMQEPPNIHPSTVSATGTFEIDGITYILPTQVNGEKLSKEDAVQRFKDTGEHLGAFDSEKNARFYETNYIVPR